MIARDWLAGIAQALLAGADDLAAMAQFDAGMAVGGAAAAQSFLEGARFLGEAAEPKAAIALLGPAGADAATATGQIVVHAFAAVRIDYPAQPDASAARVALAARAAEFYARSDLDAAVLNFVARLAGEASLQLSRMAATRVPLVRVETALSLPSSLLAFDLYGDPARGAEIVARNRARTPLLMPAVFEALGS